MSAKIISIMLAALCCCVVNASEVSRNKIKTIEAIVRGEFNKVVSPARPQKWQTYKTVNDANIKKNIEALVKKRVTPFETKAKQVGIPPKVRTEINRNIAKRFPYKNHGEIAVGALKEAEVAFPLVKVGDEVTIRYHRNGIFSKLSGKVQSVRENGQVYEVNNKLVRVSEILASDRKFFDPAINALKRREFIDDFQDPKKFAMIKREYTNSLMAEALEKMVENEKNGYIFYQNRWVTAKYVTDQRFNYYKKKTADRHKIEAQYFYQKKSAPKPKKKDE